MERLRRYWIVALAMLLLASAYPPFGYSSAEMPGNLSGAAKEILRVEQDYFMKRTSNDWEAAYAYQHPDFKRKVSFEEFKFFDGLVPANFRETTRAHVSGGLGIPAPDYVKKNLEKKDILGFPSARRFQMLTNQLIKVQRQEIKKISISKDGNYARVSSVFFGRERMNPGLVRGHIEIPVEIPVDNYWEKVSGKWHVTLLESPVHLSGNTLYHFVPLNQNVWSNEANFISISPDELAADKS